MQYLVLVNMYINYDELKVLINISNYFNIQFYINGRIFVIYFIVLID